MSGALDFKPRPMTEMARLFRFSPSSPAWGLLQSLSAYAEWSDKTLDMYATGLHTWWVGPYYSKPLALCIACTKAVLAYGLLFPLAGTGAEDHTIPNTAPCACMCMTRSAHLGQRFAKPNLVNHIHRAPPAAQPDNQPRLFVYRLLAALLGAPASVSNHSTSGFLGPRLCTWPARAIAKRFSRQPCQYTEINKVSYRQSLLSAPPAWRVQ
jgi:hypothetical protein